jgi:hypothetical protein
MRDGPAQPSNSAPDDAQKQRRVDGQKQRGIVGLITLVLALPISLVRATRTAVQNEDIDAEEDVQAAVEAAFGMAKAVGVGVVATNFAIALAKSTAAVAGALIIGPVMKVVGVAGATAVAIQEDEDGTPIEEKLEQAGWVAAAILALAVSREQTALPAAGSARGSALVAAEETEQPALEQRARRGAVLAVVKETARSALKPRSLAAWRGSALVAAEETAQPALKWRARRVVTSAAVEETTRSALKPRSLATLAALVGTFALALQAPPATMRRVAPMVAASVGVLSVTLAHRFEARLGVESETQQQQACDLVLKHTALA